MELTKRGTASTRDTAQANGAESATQLSCHVTTGDIGSVDVNTPLFAGNLVGGQHQADDSAHGLQNTEMPPVEERF